jgi:hypothetical protein
MEAIPGSRTPTNAEAGCAGAATGPRNDANPSRHQGWRVIVQMERPTGKIGGLTNGAAMLTVIHLAARE